MNNTDTDEALRKLQESTQLLRVALTCFYNPRPEERWKYEYRDHLEEAINENAVFIEGAKKKNA